MRGYDQFTTALGADAAAHPNNGVLNSAVAHLGSGNGANQPNALVVVNTPDARFQGTVQLQVTRSRTGNAGVDTEAAPRLDVRWSFAKKQALVLKGNFRRYKYADPTVAQFNERLASLEYVTNL